METDVPDLVLVFLGSLILFLVYVIIRMIVNICKGSDLLDGLFKRKK